MNLEKAQIMDKIDTIIYRKLNLLYALTQDWKEGILSNVAAIIAAGIILDIVSLSTEAKKWAMEVFSRLLED